MGLVLAAFGGEAASATVEELLGEADKAYADGLATFDLATAASVFADKKEEVKSRLVETRGKLDRAEGLYREVLSLDSNQDGVRKKLFEIHDIGKPCCGKKSLWDEYGVPRDEKK